MRELGITAHRFGRSVLYRSSCVRSCISDMENEGQNAALLSLLRTRGQSLSLMSLSDFLFETSIGHPNKHNEGIKGVS